MKKAKMKNIQYYIDHVKDEIDGALEYAEQYIMFKTEYPAFSKMYHEMSAAEMNHCNNMISMGNDYISDLSFVPEDDKELWHKCVAKATEKMGMVKLMLSK